MRPPFATTTTFPHDQSCSCALLSATAEEGQVEFLHGEGSGSVQNFRLLDARAMSPIVRSWSSAPNAPTIPPSWRSSSSILRRAMSRKNENRRNATLDQSRKIAIKQATSVAQGLWAKLPRVPEPPESELRALLCESEAGRIRFAHLLHASRPCSFPPTPTPPVR
jgi:hypothetical protein